MTKKHEESYLQQAKKAGFIFVSFQEHGKHRHLTMCKDGIEFKATLPSSPSDSRRGPYNWIRDLRKQWAKAQGETSMGVPKLTEEEIIKGVRASVLQLHSNLELKLIKKDKGGGYYSYFISSGSLNPGFMISKFIGDRLLSEELVTLDPKTSSGFLTLKGIQTAETLLGTQEKKEAIEAELQEAFGTPTEELTERERRLIEATRELTDSELETVVSYGLLALQDEATIQAKKAQERLDRLANGIKIFIH